MWLNPDSLKHWMRPGDTDLIFAEVHPVVGGTFRLDMQDEDGRIFAHTGQYLEIQRPYKLVFTWHSTVLGEHASQVTVEFSPQGENCLMTLVHDLPPDQALYDDHQRGWTTIFDLLEQHQKQR